MSGLIALWFLAMGFVAAVMTAAGEKPKEIFVVVGISLVPSIALAMVIVPGMFVN